MTRADIEPSDSVLGASGGGHDAVQIAAHAGAMMGEFEDMLDAFFAGDITPVIDSVISLEEIPSAHERLSEGEGFGKIIVRP
jgi:D-arabinose 1-dehydrogenase-like Zn-dependent alcohol dehydrogenase